jgi:signal transduction histidine kinase
MSQRPIHVLLIDDDEDEFIVIRDLLSEGSGDAFKLEWVGSFESALKRMAERAHDVYLIDYRMGARTGIDLIREAGLRGLRSPMILLTGFDDKNVDREAISVGAADYLQKSELSAYLLERSIRYSIYRTQMRAQAVSQDRMASIGMLASSLAHEIGTPLGVIRGRAEYLGMQVGEDASIKKNVDIIVSQIDRVSDLIRSLLNLARGDSSEQLTTTSVSRAVTDVIELLGPELRKNDIEIVNGIAPGSKMSVFGQPQKLHQVILNLFVNAIHAIQAAKKGGRTLGHAIRVSARDLGTRWSIEVEDTGSGMSEDTRANLFRPFYTTKESGVGTGLGLATSLWIVQSWSGTIEVESVEGRGSTFRIQIPKSA